MENRSFDISHLIPTPEFLYGFSTCTSIGSHSSIQLVALDDLQLGVHKVSSSTTHNTVQPPAPEFESPDQKTPTLAWEALYPAGSVNPSGPIPGGFGFYLSGPSVFAQRLESATEAIFSYRMMLQDGWEWMVVWATSRTDVQAVDRKNAANVSISGLCGGKFISSTYINILTIVLNYRPNAIGELYAYLPLTTSNATQLSSVPPLSVANADYGISVGRGAFKLDKAISRWMSIAFRIKLNDVGELEVWTDGRSVMTSVGLSFRESEAGKIKGMHLQTFFGVGLIVHRGHGTDWASPKDQRAWFSDVTGVILR
ncbi:hypothetical protein CVT25_002292 [Psilocybe cyanescens]|uniref:Polysaccharide lyase 14 domain-containing protein n=1 Tax=Psilocybe cyanescens TaxID=93625 RepID=A0A409WK80_PSICY|nr:hypothetical protein CVT25_002292 [Psilocybe cyanescens]